MALVTIANGGTLSGSAGGVTAQGGANGLFLRARVRPKQSKSGPQRAAQTQLIQANNFWANILANSDRAGWNAFAVVNPTISLGLRVRQMTGQGWFILYQIYNGYGALHGLPPLSFAGAILKPPPPTHVQGSLIYTPGTANQFSWQGVSSYEMDGSEQYGLWVSIPTKPGVMPKPSDMRFVHQFQLGRPAAPFQVEDYGEDDPFYSARASGSTVCMTFYITGLGMYCSEDVMLYQFP